MFTTACHCGQVRLAAPRRPRRYGNALEFCRCRHCGCVTHHERVARHADGLDTLAINVRNAEQPDTVARLPIRMLDGAATWRVLRETVEPDLWLSPDDKVSP